jgi:hypothetical protein
LIESNSAVFWTLVYRQRDVNGSQRFPLLGGLTLSLLVLPHASAAAERTFSAVNLNKTSIRNRLGFTTLNGLLKELETTLENGSAFNMKNCGRGYEKAGLKVETAEKMTLHKCSSFF